MSASLVIDLGNTCQLEPSLPGGIVVSPSGYVAGLSGQLVGNTVDLINADSYCNVYVAGRSVTSGYLRIGVQTADVTTSGSFTDPTSGLTDFPTSFSSGGWLVIGQSGTAPGIFNAGEGVSGQFLLSGFCAAAGFLRNGRYARLVLGSGFYDGPIQAGFVSQRKVTGSGGGFTWAPAATGTVNV